VCVRACVHDVCVCVCAKMRACIANVRACVANVRVYVCVCVLVREGVCARALFLISFLFI